jgi:hypothetical protein
MSLKKRRFPEGREKARSPSYAYSQLLRTRIEDLDVRQEVLADDVGISDRTLRRYLSGSLPPRRTRQALERKLAIADEEASRALETGADDYRRKVWKVYREERAELKELGRNYYRRIAAPGFAVVSRPSWILPQPIPLSDLDQELQRHWVKDVPEPALPRLDVLGDEKYSDFITRVSPEIRQDDNFCYRLLEARFDNGTPQLKFSSSRYRQHINSCDVLGFELAEWKLRSRGSSRVRTPRTSGVDLRWRSKPQVIFDFKNRSACPSVSTALIVRNTSKGDLFFLQPRTSPRLLDTPGGLHVVPSGQFQPDTAEDINHHRDFSVTRTVMRELAEEVLGVGEVQDMIRDLSDFYQDERVKPFVKGLKDGAINAHFLGLGVDPVPTKPELFVALIVDAARVGEQHLNFIGNWESDGKILTVPLDQLEMWSQDKRMIPDGAMCLQLVHQKKNWLMKES